MNKRQVAVAIVQHPPVFLDTDATLDRAEVLLGQAAASGAEIVAFPETWLPGYPIWLDRAPGAAYWDHGPSKDLHALLNEQAVVQGGPRWQRLAQMAANAGVYLVMGAHERSGGTLYNTIIYATPEGSTSLHRKLVPTFNERLVWGRGDGSMLQTVDTPSGPLGALVCWEHWMPLARAAMHAQHEVVHVAQWPAVPDLHLLGSRHYAFEGQCYVLASGVVFSRGDALAALEGLAGHREAGAMLKAMPPGPNGELFHNGGSAIIAPDSSFVIEPCYDVPDILVADLDLTIIGQGHQVMDSDGHYARPDVFHLSVNTAPQPGVSFEPPLPRASAKKG